MQNKGHNNIRKRRKKKHKRTIALLCRVFMCFLLLYGAFYLAFYLKLKKIPEHKICERIYIGREDVSGLTKKQALQHMQDAEEAYGEAKVTVWSGKKQEELQLQELGFGIKNKEKLVEQAFLYGKEGGVFRRYFEIRKLRKEKKVWEPEYQLDVKQANKVLEEKVTTLFPGAVDAKITRKQGEFVVSKEKKGLELDTKATLQKLTTFLNEKWNGKSCKIEAVSRLQEPKIKKKQLLEIQDNLGNFSTYCGSGQVRVENIKVGTERIDGTVLLPGEEFSANAGMSPFSKEDGYVDAGAYENGQIVQSLGGGICQVSTTLYNAVIQAELEVTSRQGHSMLVDYVKPSRDAAIAGDYKDLRFKNNTKSPIYIQGFVMDGRVYFNIYGKETRPENRNIEFVSETLATEEVQKKYIADPELVLGKMVRTDSGRRGAKSQLWKIVYEDGKEVSREIFNKTTYKPSVVKIRVGIQSDDPKAVRIVKKAIQTQDEAKITSAIQEAKTLKEEEEQEQMAEENKTDSEARGQ